MKIPFVKKDPKAPQAEDYEFLPVALEVIETPPSPLGRILLWLLASMIVIALLWAILGKIDEVAVTDGKIIPSGYTKVIQAEDKGVVKRICVKNGQHVQSGDVLIEMDTVISQAELARLKHESDFQHLQLIRFIAERDRLPFEVGSGDYDREEIKNQSLLYETRKREYQAQIEALQQGNKQYEAALRHTSALTIKARKQLVIAADQLRRVRQLHKNDLISLFEVQRYEQEAINYQQEISALAEEKARIRHQLAENKQKLEQFRGEWMREIASGIVESRRQLSQVEEELKKAVERVRLSTIVSPISGTVEQLAVHTVGGVVTEAQPLMWVVPIAQGLEIEVWAKNMDIGYIKKGQKAEVKVETFNFQKYGTLEATVQSVASEATEDEVRGLVYRVILVSSKDHFMRDGEKRPLTSGMAVTGEIQLRQKRVIEYFLDPFKTYMSEGLRER